MLVFQTDSLLCRRGIDEFDTWDYIGAPWRVDDLWCAGKPWLTSVGGNGGLSLRSRRKTLECIDAIGYTRGQCEDVYYAEAMPKRASRGGGPSHDIFGILGGDAPRSAPVAGRRGPQYDAAHHDAAAATRATTAAPRGGGGYHEPAPAAFKRNGKGIPDWWG